MELEAFIDYMLEHWHHDPLAVAWFAMSTYIKNLRYEELKNRRQYLFGTRHGSVILVMMGPLLTHDSDDEFARMGLRLGLWHKDSGGVMRKSNTWIEWMCTIVYMYMRTVCGRDVASIIARALARMYLDDFEWLTNGKSEEQIRMRICKHAQHAYN